MNRGAKSVDTIVIGGGIVGLSIAYGLARDGERVRILDEGDEAFRAARGNFGLVWVQGKGAGMPDYARWSMAAARRWPEFAQELTDLTGVDLQLSQPGGLHLCLSEAEVDARVKTLEQLADSVGEDYRFEILDHVATKAICPSIGPDVVGASYMATDGHVSPLRLLRALAAAIRTLDAEICPNQRVEMVSFRNGEFHVTSDDNEYSAPRVVLAAGLGNARLAPMVRLKAPVKPVRGQVLISERVVPFLSMPTASVRQTGDGGVQIGDSKEEVGLDSGTTIEQVSRMADRAVRSFPVLADVNLVRTWGALRIMTKDGYPIYEESTDYPGAFIVTCHSGVTLASQHAGSIVQWIRGGQRPDHIQNFKAGRFDV